MTAGSRVRAKNAAIKPVVINLRNGSAAARLGPESRPAPDLRQAAAAV
jgi:hypothetical protein